MLILSDLLLSLMDVSKNAVPVAFTNCFARSLSMQELEAVMAEKQKQKSSRLLLIPHSPILSEVEGAFDVWSETRSISGIFEY